MVKKNCIIFVIVAVIVVAALVGIITWLAVRSGDSDSFIIIDLEGEGVGDIEQKAAFTRVPGTGDTFWWFYPTTGGNRTSRPIILWLDGVTGIPPSLLANFGMFGPYDFNLNRRENSWVDEYNLLFIDAPLGTGFSTAAQIDRIPRNVNESADLLIYTLQSFYRLYENYSETPLYLFGEGHGSQLALALAVRLKDADHISHNLKGVVIGNGIVSPALALTKLGFYLEELGYIDGNGRNAIETLSEDVNSLVQDNNLEDAFDRFLSLGDFVNERAGAVAVNLGHIVERLTREPEQNTTDYFGKKEYVEDLINYSLSLNQFMDEIIAPKLGITNSKYDGNRDAVIEAFKDSFMSSAVNQVQDILQNTNYSVTIYNGNLDAVSNTPGQLEWVDNLEWDGQAEFRNSSRTTLIINNLIEGYFRETGRLQFYWINVAGQSVPLDNPVAIRRILQRITRN